ncbi:MAG: hypothetical protein RL262_1795, partial [Bacteroidota bacterium]
MSDCTIRAISISDLPQLQKIGKTTFAETFTEHNIKEDLDKYLEESFSNEKLSSELNNPHSSFYFAEIENNVLGYLKINFGASQTELKDNEALEIERIYVLQAFHGKKLGQA